jgi:DedD protein
MQHNSTNHKNKSQVLRSTEQAKRKSRHRLMGSIFLLLVAIVILLNITSKVRPIPITPQKIEIQSTISNKSDEHKDASGGIKANSTTTAASAAIAMPKTASSAVVATTTVATAAVASVSNKESVVATDTAPAASIVATNQTEPAKDSKENNKFNFSARIVVEKTQTNKPTPEQILNGAEYNSSEPSKYYIQLVALSDKTKLINLQHKLAQNGIKTFIQTAKSETKSVSYRLRMGPYTSKESAQQALAKLNETR